MERKSMQAQDLETLNAAHLRGDTSVLAEAGQQETTERRLDQRIRAHRPQEYERLNDVSRAFAQGLLHVPSWAHQLGESVRRWRLPWISARGAGRTRSASSG